MYSQYITVSDYRFREFLKEEMPEAFNSNDKLNVGHPSVTGAIDLTVPSRGIASLDGIEFFTSLTGLYCEQNKLTRLDLTGNTQLKRLWCSSNRLTVLKVSQNTHLQTLDCSFNQLTQLDLGENTGLRLLLCHGNLLTSLNLFGTIGLSELSIGVGDKAGGVKKNPIVKLQVNDAIKTHREVKNAKFRQDQSIYISTYTTDGTLLCANYDPILECCLSFPRFD